MLASARLALAVVIVVVLCTGASATLVVESGTAFVDSNLRMSGATNIALSFAPHHEATFQLTSEEESSSLIHRIYEAHFETWPNIQVSHQMPSPAKSGAHRSFVASLEKIDPWASMILTISADEVQRPYPDAQSKTNGPSQISYIGEGNSFLGENFVGKTDLFRRESTVLDGPAIVWLPADLNQSWLIPWDSERQIEYIEFHGFEVVCISGDCPSDSSSQTTGPFSIHPYVALSGEIVLETLKHSDVGMLALWSKELQMNFEGILRLPQASCRPHLCDGHSTLTLEGQDLSATFEMVGDGQVSSNIEGKILAADQDDSPILRPKEAIAGVVGLASIFLLLKGLLWSLLQVRELQQEKRNKLYIFIKENPGATFREVVKNTQIATGTARHHLGVLRRTGLIQTHQHHATLRFFENHDRFNRTWNTVVLLREPALADLHAWLMKHPGAIQKEILAHTELAWDWGRSTTQHRLSRLHEEGLVNIKLQGRRKVYTAVEVAPLPEERATLASPAVHWSASQV